ncbi:MAG: hypothetical protein A3I05_01900 [Deltaproteobacteria bacterium RIFCSPLOWO2_02_FULL_44_10]|nr:MAG: hypothetical protein A3C46_03225 [Deltaproteobacteria bacterium RIFCSPHIGHO2_02_FULL_44_16]OGQ47537.1 MAG: hypothetical protein A3I05_01900 [Deltaproteobacteria bacterium RIFCSPLOWO2_02_FULL_44_10]
MSIGRTNQKVPDDFLERLLFQKASGTSFGLQMNAKSSVRQFLALTSCQKSARHLLARRENPSSFFGIYSLARGEPDAR